MQEELVTLPSVSQSDLRRGMPENLVKRGVKFGRFCAAFEGDLDASSDHVSVMYLLREGACTYDVCKIFELFDPLPPCHCHTHITYQYCGLLLGDPLPPPS